MGAKVEQGRVSGLEQSALRHRVMGASGIDGVAPHAPEVEIGAFAP